MTHSRAKETGTIALDSAITLDGGNGANGTRGSKVGMSQLKSRTKRTIKELFRTCGSQLRSYLRLVYILRLNSKLDLIVELQRFSIELSSHRE
ncbi:hypothetical protein J6590_085265 [Homalodisca vitripennis]|nr:hypothetical protein J6590_085265 [Homalodisca vitripennis]